MCSGSGYMTLGYARMDLCSQNKRHKIELNIHGKASPMKPNYLHAGFCFFFCQHRDDAGEDGKTVPAVIWNHISFYHVLVMEHF